MNSSIYKEDLLLMALSVIVLGTALGIQGSYDLEGWQEQLVAVLDFIANEAPHI